MYNKTAEKVVTLLLLCLSFIPSLTAAQNSASISWQQLLPISPPFDDPFAKLNQNQIADIGFVIGMRAKIAKLKESSTSNDQNVLSLIETYSQEVDEALVQIKKDNIDIDFLLSKREEVRKYREQQATDVAHEKLEQQISISGFALPVSLSDGKLNQFFLVEMSPTMSIAHDHKAPHPNQVILVNYPQGSAINNGETKITVIGKLTKHWLSENILLPDGHETEYESSYQIEANRVIFN